MAVIQPNQVTSTTWPNNYREQLAELHFKIVHGCEEFVGGMALAGGKQGIEKLG